MTLAWRVFFYPIFALILYSSSCYLETHYVSKDYFDRSVAKIEESQRVISGKVDSVLIQNSAALQRTENLDERIIRLESSYDKGKTGFEFHVEDGEWKVAKRERR
jgi:hypothetical protein